MLPFAHPRVIAALVLAALMGGPAQAADFVKINNVSYEPDRHSVVLEISGPVTISTRSLKAPPRLVVDVPTATLFSPNQELVIRDALVKRVRISQFQIYPPVVRVVIETATEKEPLIAVQQTKDRLYITLATARSPGQGASPAHDHDHGHRPAEKPTPRPTPTPRGYQILPDASPAAQPARVEQRPVATPSPRPSPSPAAKATPRPVLKPTPSPSPAAAPSLAPPARSGEKRGEAAHETLPILPPERP